MKYTVWLEIEEYDEDIDEYECVYQNALLVDARSLAQAHAFIEKLEALLDPE